jgi:hypothetical protein
MFVGGKVTIYSHLFSLCKYNAIDQEVGVADFFPIMNPVAKNTNL